MSYPIQDGDNIPEWLAKMVYKAYTNKYGTQQSYERMRERGGFGKAEVIMLLAQNQIPIMCPQEAVRLLKEEGE